MSSLALLELANPTIIILQLHASLAGVKQIQRLSVEVTEKPYSLLLYMDRVKPEKVPPSPPSDLPSLSTNDLPLTRVPPSIVLTVPWLLDTTSSLVESVESESDVVVL